MCEQIEKKCVVCNGTGDELFGFTGYKPCRLCNVKKIINEKDLPL